MIARGITLTSSGSPNVLHPHPSPGQDSHRQYRLDRRSGDQRGWVPSDQQGIKSRLNAPMRIIAKHLRRVDAQTKRAVRAAETGQGVMLEAEERSPTFG